MSEFVLWIIRLVITGICLTIAKYVVPAVKSYIKNNEDEWLIKMVKIAVKAQEQEIKESGMGEIKKGNVLELIDSLLQKRDIEVDDDYLDSLIENCVFILNHPDLAE